MTDLEMALLCLPREHPDTVGSPRMTFLSVDGKLGTWKEEILAWATVLASANMTLWSRLH